MNAEQLEALRTIIEHLAKDRHFRPREIEHYMHWGPVCGIAPSVAVRTLVKLGYLERCGAGEYFPTAAGWFWIDGKKPTPTSKDQNAGLPSKNRGGHNYLRARRHK